MKSTHSELTQRYLVLIKIDAENLYNRIHSRQHEYMEVFSLKRDREIFKEIFRSRYAKTDLADLAHLPIEVIELINDFYNFADDLYWYLKTTQDMPNTIEDEITRRAHILGKKYEILQLYIGAELNGTAAEAISEFEEIKPTLAGEDYFITQGELEAMEEGDSSPILGDPEVNTDDDS